MRRYTLARHILFSPVFMKLFDFMQLPTFEIASDAAASFREILTRHKVGPCYHISRINVMEPRFASPFIESTGIIWRGERYLPGPRPPGGHTVHVIQRVSNPRFLI